MRTRIKVCGLTTPEDAAAALEAGADYLGLIFTESARRVTVERAVRIRDELPPDAPLVGVFAAEPPDVVGPIQRAVGLSVIQVAGWLHADPLGLPFEVWHVLRGASLPDPAEIPLVPLHTFLLDTHDPARPGGTGRVADWGWAKSACDAGLRLIVAGGLHSGNVRDLLWEVRPFGVDASSGLESEPGRKDPARIREFIARVREADRDRPRRS